MKKHLPGAVILSALLLVLCLYAFATEEDISSLDADSPTLSESVDPAESLQTPPAEELPPSLVPLDFSAVLPHPSPLTVNGVPLGSSAARIEIDGIPYVTAAPVLQAVLPSADVSIIDGRLVAKAPGFSLSAAEGTNYFSANGRYLYAPSEIQLHKGTLLLPASSLAKALGCIIWNTGAQAPLSFLSHGPLITDRKYPLADLYWLSKAIHAESGNQPMKGRIAVGTVILNRVASEQFPNTIRDVVFEPNQFSPVANGTIYAEADKDSIVAAKLCLDGVKEADNCLYFNVTAMSSWASQQRNYVCTIGGHNFYE